MSITTIWYFAATIGDTPDRICPVIMPGRATSPTANRELIIGISAALIAIRRVSVKPIPRCASAQARSPARLTVFIAPEKIMPASGTR